MDYFAELKHELGKYLDSDQLLEVEQAYRLAFDAHHGQKRRSGEPYITHPVATAIILATMRMDYQSIIAALLHDTLEDTPVTKEQLIQEFGEDVAELVDGVSKLTQMQFESRIEAQAENFRKMVLAMVRDIRVILVKLADRLHNMRTIDAMPPQKKRRISRETLEIYAPIANRLGIHHFYVELEERGFEALYPMRYRVLQQAVKKAMGNRREIFRKIEHELQVALNKHDIHPFSIIGRQKHLYSIYKKMRNKKGSFAEIMDVYAFRVLSDKVDTCYRVLGVVHNLFKPRPGRFKDYIALPKVNGYQSLHTSLYGPFGVPLEIQIRTEDMDRVAENGIAAHWLYKTSGLDVSEAQLRAHEWIKGLMEMQQSTGSSMEFIENVKIDLFPHEVYVFTPGGDILELPRGSTPVDFAYAVHSDIGNSCVAVKLNRRLAPLSKPLTNGQTVEIITAPGANPNPAWLNFVVTAKARSNIRHFLKNQQRTEAISLGKRLLSQALSDLGKTLEDVPADSIQSVVDELSYRSMDELYQEIGLGNQVAPVVVRRLLHELAPTQLIAEKNFKKPLLIKGTEGMVLSFASCCRPIPGDPIVGFLQSGRGIEVHVDECKHVEHFRNYPDRFINMSWEDDVLGEFKVDLLVEVSNQRGVLADIANAIALAEANIDNIVVDPRDGRYSDVKLTLTVRDRTHLARIMRRIRSVQAVTRITRMRANK